MHGNQSGNLHNHASSFDDLGGMLKLRAEQFPDRPAFIYEDETGATREWTYRQLHERSATVGAWIAERATRGDRALLVYPPGLDFIAGFFGCIYAGVLPVPATYPKPRRPLPRAEAIIQDCAPRIALTHSSVLAGLRWEDQSDALKALTWQATDELDGGENTSFAPCTNQGQDLAFLQYTSGSTSDPRGVMVSHGNILHNLESIRIGFQLAPASESEPIPSGVFWLPAYHDMGLIGGILTPLYVGGTSYLLAPTTFLRKPMRWLELISETQAEISGSPNFGFELVIQKTDAAERAKLNLENWRLAFCGAEPINPSTLLEFAAAFDGAGFRPEAFYPCYGMAEVTLLVTGGNGPAEPKVLSVDRKALGGHRVVPVEKCHPDALDVVGCGTSLDGQVLKIVEPQSRQTLKDGEVGEIWVRGGSVARGYWDQEELNRETFAATISGESQDQFLRTGDLGFWWEGELFVTGRLKDVIIIRGRNYYPQDIERTALQTHPAVDQGAAFAVPGTRQEELVVVHQVHREHRKTDLAAVLQSIRSSILAEHEVEPAHVLMIRPVSLPMTSSGKVQRQRCREQYLNDELAIVAEWQANEEKSIEDADNALVPPPFLSHVAETGLELLEGEVQDWLIAWLTQRANLLAGAMQPATPFAELGIDSLTAVEISQELDQVLGLEMPPMVIWSHPSADGLSKYLAEQLKQAQNAGDAAEDTSQSVAQAHHSE